MISWMSRPRPLPSSCPSVCTAWAARGETVEEACAVHGIDVDKLLTLVNEEANKSAQ